MIDSSGPNTPDAVPLPIAASQRFAALLLTEDHGLYTRAAELRSQGHDVINLSIVDPELPPPPLARELLAQLISAPAQRQSGPPFDLRTAISGWFQSRYRTSIDPVRELVTLPTVDQGIVDLLQVLLNQGDAILTTDPSRPSIRFALAMAGATTIPLPLRAEQDFLPDLKTIAEGDLARAKLILLDFPQVPTGATATANILHQLVHFARDHNVLIIRLADYSEFTFDGSRTMSLLEIPGARFVAIELHSLSLAVHLKTWPVAAAIGHTEALRLLRRYRSFIPQLLHPAIQQAMGELLIRLPPEWVTQRNATYQQRRDHLTAALEACGFHVWRARAVPALWVGIPTGYTSIETAQVLLEETHLLVTPGTAYGSRGEGYLSLSLTVDEQRFQEALRRLGRVRLAPRDLKLGGDEPH
ncbi:MAG: aminotransferase class I/II-fold pyridoxal phosphate-dependent enzyme [Chloroflexi bacterium]|nr:aminotransferase class I/II-fold pyridoxal phosphate-dependent enzyme [Chloroflexota bacterium]